MNAAENLRQVELFPETEDFPAGGASVQHFAKAGKVTLARLSRKNGKYRMTIVPAEIVTYEREKMKAMSSQTTPEWPVAFTKLQVSADRFLEEYPCNHIHGIYGDYVREMVDIAKILGIEYVIL